MQSSPSKPITARGLLAVLAAMLAVVLTIGGCGERSGGSGRAQDRDGSPERPLMVLLVPTESGQTNLMDDYEPLFSAITRVHGLHFDLRMGSSYAAVVEGMRAGQVDIAHFGAVTYHQARRAGVAELLAVAVVDGEAVYHAGIFHLADSGMSRIEDLNDKTVALGDPNSTSSFNYPVAMMLDAGLDPVRDLRGVLMSGSHSASLSALQAGHVDAAAASVSAYDKMVREGTLDGTRVVPLAKSEPIPNPPLAMRSGLSEDVKSRLREIFADIHEQDGVRPEMILAYGGALADRYDSDIDDAFIAPALERLGAVTAELRQELADFANRARPGRRG